MGKQCIHQQNMQMVSYSLGFSDTRDIQTFLVSLVFGGVFTCFQLQLTLIQMILIYKKGLKNSLIVLQMDTILWSLPNAQNL